MHTLKGTGRPKKTPKELAARDATLSEIGKRFTEAINYLLLEKLVKDQGTLAKEAGYKTESAITEAKKGRP